MSIERRLVDALFAAALALLALPSSAGAILGSSWALGWEITAVAALVAGHAAVAVRRIAPVVAFGMVGAVVLVLLALTDVEPGGFSPILVPSVVVFPVVLYSVAAWRPHRIARLALAASGAGCLVVVARLWGAGPGCVFR